MMGFMQEHELWSALGNEHMPEMEKDGVWAPKKHFAGCASQAVGKGGKRPSQLYLFQILQSKIQRVLESHLRLF